MALNKGFARNAATDAVDARLMDAELFLRNPDGSVRTGMLWTNATNGNIVAATSSMSVIVAIADFVLSRGTNDGAYRLSNYGVATVTLAGAPASNSRYDVIYAKQNDSTAGDSVDTAVIDKVTGVAAASPTIPAVPTGALALATILVPAGVTATNAGSVIINNIVQYTTVLGGTLQYRTQAAAVADRANTITGQLSQVPSLGITYRNDGTALRYWQQPQTVTTMTPSNQGAFNLGTTGSSLFLVSISEGTARVDFRLRFAGSGMAWGDVRYQLPGPAFDVFATTSGMSGSVDVNDANGGTYWCAAGIIGDGTWRVWRTGTQNGSSTSWGTSPQFTPEQGDTITGFFEYPTAPAT